MLRHERSIEAFGRDGWWDGEIGWGDGMGRGVMRWVDGMVGGMGRGVMRWVDGMGR